MELSEVELPGAEILDISAESHMVLVAKPVLRFQVLDFRHIIADIVQYRLRDNLDELIKTMFMVSDYVLKRAGYGDMPAQWERRNSREIPMHELSRLGAVMVETGQLKAEEYNRLIPVPGAVS